jgi:tRNA threonylcarbamoyladenosine biosynthesis protein TsaE
LIDPAKKIISLLNDYEIVVFVGSMGSGKTTLIAELCRLLDVHEVSSPTYSIVNTYNSNSYGEIYHFDFFRIKDENEALQSGLEELIDSGKLCLIEWPEKIYNLLSNKFVRVDIKVKNNIRIITVST